MSVQRNEAIPSDTKLSPAAIASPDLRRFATSFDTIGPWSNLFGRRSPI
jgi:hypothetical protein